MSAKAPHQLLDSGNTHAMKRNHLAREVARHLGPYYVYAFIGLRDDTIFYAGNGKGARLLAHGSTIAGAYTFQTT